MTGSLQIKNGIYYAVVRIPDEFGKSKPKWVDTGILVAGNNKKQVEKRLREILFEYENKNIIFTKNIDFADYISNWLEIIKHTIEQTTFESYHQYVHKHIIPYFNIHKVTLDKISKQHLQYYYNFQFEHGRVDGKGGLSAKTLKNQHAVIGKSLKDAMMDDLIVYNPNDRVKLPKKQPFIGKYYSIEQTKSKASNRTLYIIPETFEYLTNLRQYQEKNRMIMQGSYYKNSDHVCVWDNGKPFKPDYISKKFPKLLRKYNLPHIRFHELRHTAGSLLLENGLSTKQIQEYLGHENISTTLDIYGHLSIEGKKEASNTIGGILKI